MHTANFGCLRSVLNGLRSSNMIRSALDHIALTYHDVTVFAIPEFKSLEVLEKKIFALILLSINPKTNPNPNPDPNCKKTFRKKKFDSKV